MNDMKDWPMPLRINAEACDLAPNLYFSHCRVYGGAVRPFHELPPRIQSSFVTLASEMIQLTAPHATLDAHREVIAQTNQERAAGDAAIERKAGLLGAKVVEFQR